MYVEAFTRKYPEIQFATGLSYLEAYRVEAPQQ